MKLTVLGCYGPFPKAKGACSGYLLEGEDTKILLDCGNGVLSRLLAICGDLNQLDAIIISHLHPDHMSDLLVLRYAVDIGKKMGKIEKSIPLYLPSSPKEDFDRVQYKEAFELHEVKDGMAINIKNIDISFKKTDHPVECYASAFKKGNKCMVYSGDTKYDEGLIPFASNADLFLCEGGIPEKYRTETTPHLSAKQAAEIAAEGRVKRLVLTHFYPDVKLPSLLQEAQEHFNGMIEMAEEGKSYFV